MIKVVLFDVGNVLIRFSGPQLKLYHLAKKIKQKNVRIAVLSNVNVFPGVILKWIHVHKGFDPVILSYEEKIRKPSPEIYERAIRKMGIKPQEIIFVDNLPGNLKSARGAGMQTIHAVGTRQVAADLKSILKKENKLDI